MKYYRIACLFLGTALLIRVPLLQAQDRDFLTANEVEQVREAQDPNDRLTLYVHFAKQRMDLIQQYLAKEKPGRSIFIHDALEDYTSIIEAVDSVADDALKHNHPIDVGMIKVIGAEKDFLAQLNKIQDSEPKDLERYKFVLSEAIDTTSDSQELSMEDSKKRTTELSAKDAKEKSERESEMSTDEQKDRKKAAKKEEEPKKKIPSLLRPGEKPPDQPQ
ncbi:MAG TPA: hypothetical protein VHZ55_16400 [Bryobacteraceae bacterium]|jgi:hypothetical protein|nr:hypothetical protein [Bryobacteraceae bacterium]